MSEVHVTTQGVVVHNPAVSPTNPLAGVPVVATATAGKTSAVKGQVTNGPIISNPA
jgi:hypothetical protein